MKNDDGVTLIEVMVAFVVLIIAIIPLSYLFTTALISAGQANYQQTALSIAEKWTEILSNTTPPVNNYGEVVVDSTESPSGPAASTATTTLASGSNGHALNSVTAIYVASTTNLAAASAANPQVAFVTTGSGPTAVSNQISYIGLGTSPVSLICSSTCSTSSGTMATGGAVTQTEIATSSETRGGTVYGLHAEYEWASVQNSGTTSTTISSGSNGTALPQPTIAVASTSTFALASAASPQTANVTTSAGIQAITYTGMTATSLTGASGGTGTMTTGGAVTQTAKPNLCTSGTPQLLKLRMTVSWGPNSDVNNIQDSIMINYPPSGIQTLGFIALQLSGDSTATDSQGDPWSIRTQAPPVTISGPQNLTIYPDSYGCAFAQVLPSTSTSTYSVSVGNASSGYPAGTTYGSPSFVANGTGAVTGNVLQQPTSESQTGIPVSIGAVTRLQTSYSSSYPAYDQGTIINLSYPNTTSIEDGVSCPGVGQITCVSRGENGSGAVVNWANGAAWSSAVMPASVTRVTSVACAGTVACIGVGYGSAGAVILRSPAAASPTLSKDTVPTTLNGTNTPAVANSAGAALTQVTCPSTTQCVAIGTTSTGVGVVLSGTIGATSDTWVADTLPSTITSLSSLNCPTTATGCTAVATTATPTLPTLVSGPAGSGTWVVGTFTGVTVSALTQVVCPSATSCMAIGTGKLTSGTITPVVLSGVPGSSGLSGAVTWTVDTLTGTTPTSLSQIICPPSATQCLVTGSGTATVTGAFVLAGATTGPWTPVFPKVGTATITSISSIVCPSTTVCMATGTNAGAPVIFTGTISGSTTTWTNDALPTVAGSISSLTQLNCPAANNCLITATGASASGAPQGFLLDTVNGTSWTSISLPVGYNILYFQGVDCTSGAAGTCAAVGATSTGAVILSSTSGPSGSWSVQTPSGLTGSATTGVPIEINNSGLLPSPYATAVTAGAASNITQIPDLFPFSGGYSVWAGDCQNESFSDNVSQVATVPGGTTSVTVPLGLLSLQILHATGASTGQPYAGATVQITSATAGCSTADTYSLQSTNADGLSRTEVPYGTYTLKINNAAYGTSLVVGGNSASLTVSSVTTTYALPTPATASI